MSVFLQNAASSPLWTDSSNSKANSPTNPQANPKSPQQICQQTAALAAATQQVAKVVTTTSPAASKSNPFQTIQQAVYLASSSEDLRAKLQVLKEKQQCLTEEKKVLDQLYSPESSDQANSDSPNAPKAPLSNLEVLSGLAKEAMKGIEQFAENNAVTISYQRMLPSTLHVSS